MMSDKGVLINLTGKTAILTGGTRGIGKAIADKFLSAGAYVIATGTKQEEIKRLNSENKSDKIIYVQVDFSDPDSLSSFEEFIRTNTKIDILINNAGINKVDLNTDTTTEDFDLLNNVNLKAPYVISREVSKVMKANGYGRIVNITSIWSTITRPGRSLYTATKWGVAGLTKTLAIELAPYNVLVNAVGPGFTLTELTEATNSEDEIQKISDMIPMKRMALPEEIANLVLFLSSDLNTYLTGQNLIVDGGYTNV